MKISAGSQDYLRMVDSTSIKPVTAVNKAQEVLDPLHRPVEQTPVEAVGRAPEDGDVRRRAPGPEIVKISAQAKHSIISQAKIEERLHEKLAEVLDVEGVDLSEHQGLDYSPDAVSQRIVDYSISLFGVFHKQNESLTESEAMNKFERIIRGAVTAGFGEAMKSLEHVGLPDEVLEMGQETKSMVDERFTEFFAKSR